MADTTISECYPEIGIESRLRDWDDHFFTEIVHPLLEHTIGANSVGLWKQAREIAAKLM
jgi:hypothetical protein